MYGIALYSAPYTLSPTSRHPSLMPSILQAILTCIWPFSLAIPVSAPSSVRLQHLHICPITLGLLLMTSRQLCLTLLLRRMLCYHACREALYYLTRASLGGTIAPSSRNIALHDAITPSTAWPHLAPGSNPRAPLSRLRSPSCQPTPLDALTLGFIALLFKDS